MLGCQSARPKEAYKVLSSLSLFHVRLLFLIHVVTFKPTRETFQLGRLHSKLLGIYLSISVKELWGYFSCARNDELKRKATWTSGTETLHAFILQCPRRQTKLPALDRLSFEKPQDRVI